MKRGCRNWCEECVTQVLCLSILTGGEKTCVYEWKDRRERNNGWGRGIDGNAKGRGEDLVL